MYWPFLEPKLSKVVCHKLCIVGPILLFYEVEDLLFYLEKNIACGFDSGDDLLENVTTVVPGYACSSLDVHKSRLFQQDKFAQLTISNAQTFSNVHCHGARIVRVGRHYINEQFESTAKTRSLVTKTDKSTIL